VLSRAKLMDAENPLSVFESAAVVSLRAGDVVLFRCPFRLTDKQRGEAAAMLNEVFDDFECVILDNGQDIAILRPDPGIIARIVNRLRR